MQDTVDIIINYLNGINFIMRAKGKFKEGDDLHNIQQEEQATVVRIVAIKGRNELLVFAINTDLKL